MLIGIGVSAAAVATILLVVALASGGGGRKSAGCAILDVSVSTQKARASYVEKFSEFATSIGNEGSGRICVILAAADPQLEAIPVDASVAPEPGAADTPDAPIQIEENVEEMSLRVAGFLEHPPVNQRGSGLVAAANVAARKLQPGDRIIYLSDGFEWSKTVGHLMEMDLSPEGIAVLLSRIDRLGLLPDLNGIEVEFPLMLYHPGGLSRDMAQENRVVAFWEAWAEATGAKLTYETLSG